MNTHYINKSLNLVPRLKEYHDVGPVQMAAVQDFADKIYNDIMRVVAAHALSNESAIAVFANLKRIYED